MARAKNAHQGIYTVKNREKYVGNKNPRYLSSYELNLFQWADRSPAVIKWSAEQIVVPYYNPIKQRKARYIVDMYIKYKNRYGEIKEDLIEIKPDSETRPPKRGNKRIDIYEEQLATWYINQAKWEAATIYAKERGWNFRIFTENHIFKG